MDLLTGVLTWVLPPLLGAIIGYVTNAIAIRMLFRPLTEKRVFGIRIPLTPGLIPRERGDLAESMARMVSTELLTEEAVRNQIRATSFQNSVRESIRSVTSELLDTTLEQIEGSFETQERPADGGQSALLGSVASLLSSAFGGFTRGPSFAALMKDLVCYLVDSLADRPVESILGANKTLDGLIAGVLEGLSSERGRSEIRERASEWVGRQFETNVSIGQFLSTDDVESITRFVDSVYPALVSFLMRWLRSEGTRRELTIRGRFLVQDIVERLNSFQRFIITAAQYQRTLDENMPGIIDDAIASIEEAGMDPESRRRLVDVVRRELSSMRDRGLSEVAEKQEEGIKRTAGALAERAVVVLNGPEFRRGLLDALAGGEQEKGGTVGELIHRLFGLEGRTPGEFVAGLIFPSAAASPGPDTGDAAGSGEAKGTGTPAGGAANGLAGTLGVFFRGFLRRHGSLRIRDLLGMEDETKEQFDRALTTTLIATVDARVPEILRSIDIHDLVVSKINGLNIEEVESLLLRVIEKHLRWINIFGAMLGALIGLIQDLLRLFRLSG